MIASSCLCGSVRWTAEGPFQFMSHCHCSRCRKTHGAAFATYVGAPADGFRMTGAEHAERFESSPGAFRMFCRRCGSVVPGDPYEGSVFMPAGCMEGDPDVRPFAHIFTASKAPWYDISDELPQFAAWPPGVDLPTVPDRPAPEPPGTAPRGSCLCGGVTFVVEGKPLGVRHCHCSRCRRARSAAHASNLFTAADGVRITRGADLLTSYKVPEARYFTQVFCARCGSPMPRFDATRNIAVVAMGALDDDPGARPREHIYVASKAPWFGVTDALPRWDEAPPA